jgi:nucleoid-associated protein YgaU
MQMIGPATSEPPVMTLVITPPTVAEKPEAAPATYTVTPGDTFWSIADQTLRAAGRDPDDGAIIPYWRSLIEANRDRLRARDEPDLISSRGRCSCCRPSAESQRDRSPADVHAP